MLSKTRDWREGRPSPNKDVGHIALTLMCLEAWLIGDCRRLNADTEVV